MTASFLLTARIKSSKGGGEEAPTVEVSIKGEQKSLCVSPPPQFLFWQTP